MREVRKLNTSASCAIDQDCEGKFLASSPNKKKRTCLGVRFKIGAKGGI